ncbi:MAG: DNA repair protein RecN [Gammaproteobacteria bacterium]
MLNHIDIRNFAIVEQVSLTLDSGMTVLTGETGAGKSILIDALNLALGDRADSGVIRHGAERADISASFTIEGIDAAQQWLTERELNVDSDCLIRRTISRDGRSKGYINGQPVAMQTLRELGEMLVDIHGQHEHQSLLRPDMQRQLLDDYAGHASLVNEVAEVHRHWQDAVHDLQTLTRAANARNSRQELLTYQVRELEILNLGEAELEELNEEHSRLSHAAKLLEACRTQLQNLYENDEASALTLLTHATHEFAQLQQFDKRLAATHELISSAAIQVQEGTAELRRYLDSLELDPARLNLIDQRLTSIHELARKHKAAAADLPPLLIELGKELAALNDADVRLDQLQTEIKRAEEDYCGLAAQLSDSRAKAARELAERVSANMQQLSMAGGRFEPVLQPLTEEQFSATGRERVEFYVSANPGQPLRPLAKVASGGELSRISLAIQVITAQNGRIPTLIFDEVDVGIGGGVAEIVGRQLRALSESHQVLCVTHLPQVAAQGHNHIQVSKHANQDITGIELQLLQMPERRTEIARMLGGVKITGQTLAHAEEMLEGAQQPQREGKNRKIK